MKTLKDVKVGVTCTPAETAKGILEVMTKRRIRHLPVVDGDDILGIAVIGMNECPTDQPAHRMGDDNHFFTFEFHALVFGNQFADTLRHLLAGIAIRLEPVVAHGMNGIPSVGDLF
jgi:hypothetical protein